jgi:hypothetical protein
MKTFYMGEALNIFEALKTTMISRTVIGAEGGVQGATEVTFWDSKLGLQLEMHNSNGGCTLIVHDRCVTADKPNK